MYAVHIYFLHFHFYVNFDEFFSIFSFENVIYFNIERIRSANPKNLEMTGSTIFKWINVSTTFVEQ